MTFVPLQDTELNDLRKTIELLKKQNAVAQAAINGVINTPELVPKGDKTGTEPPRQHAEASERSTLKPSVCLSSAGSNGSQPPPPPQQPDLRIRRQHSSDSVSSINSATSHSSVGSNMDADAKNKKKNKKNWVRWVPPAGATLLSCCSVTSLGFFSSGIFHWGQGEHTHVHSWGTLGGFRAFRLEEIKFGSKWSWLELQKH